ncbi:MAG TPA: phytanoyl-CoA dioxygenase family protein, partial [Chthonomonadaceae bacterium]|nr:phytanoyl-CoA dioxygenase family protein [Chthonomonadaceae bacterium]
PHLPTDKYRLQDAVSCPAKAGDVVAFSIYTVHGSEINRTDRWRRLVRAGYRDPLNKQIGGYALGRAGLMVRGVRPLGAVRPAG